MEINTLFAEYPVTEEIPLKEYFGRSSQSKFRKASIKICVGLCAAMAMVLCGAVTAYADVGQMGFFGGYNEGKRLPKTTELILAETGAAKNNARRTETNATVYKEMIALSGVMEEFEGLLTVKSTGDVTDKDQAGTYKVTYTVQPVKNAQGALQIDRNIVFNVNWRKEGAQVVKDYEAVSWRETIGDYSIDLSQSHFNVSVLEDRTAGVTYYKGDVSMKAVYIANEAKIVKETFGSLYGYDCAWSSTETHRLDTQIYGPDWQMNYQVRPSVSVNKTLQYSENEPMAISFAGNYREVMSNQSGLQYNIFLQPPWNYDKPHQGSSTINSYNSFEQLIAPDTAFLKGHAAESDINKLFSMGILMDIPTYYQPGQAITRGQFVTMLVRAVKLPVELPEKAPTTRNRKNVTVDVVFPDVSPDREDYPYIMAAYKAGLAVGRGNGHFYVDYSIQREEALVLMLRTLGLSNLGLDPTPVTPFVDDADVSVWAKQDLYAAYKLGLIKPDSNGKIRPKEIISKAEAAALVNHLIEYMRTGLQSDYTEHIVNYAK